VIDKAAKQERKLREAQAKVEEQKRQEMLLARELAEKEDSNMLLEEQFATLQDEVDDKTRKLKKLWAKHKAASTEVEDLKAEFQTEKEDMLDTIRELTRQLKMKHLLLSHFVPFDEAITIEKRAKYDPEVDEWKVDRLETKPSSLRPKRPVSRRGARRIESEYGRRNKLIDPMNMRWRADNVVILDMEMPERRTKDFEHGGGGGIGMNYWLERVGASEEDIEIVFENEVEVSPPSNLLAAAKEKASSSSLAEKSSASSSSTASSSSSGASASSGAPSKKASSETAAASTGENADKTREKSSSSKKASSKRPPTAR
jgi:kinesin family protein 3/17